MNRGFSVLEALVACAVIATATVALAFALTIASRFTGSSTRGPARTAAQTLAESTLRDVQNAWKYGAPGAVTSSVATANGTLTVSTAGSTPGTISVNVAYSPDPQHQDSGTVTLSAPAIVRAPLPGSLVARPDRIDDPTPTSTP